MDKNEKRSDVEIGFIEKGRPKVSFPNQFNALLRKSAVYQWRQYKTNCCQVFFPLLLIILLYILQLVVSDFVQSQIGETKEVIHPTTSPAPLRLTNVSLANNCPPFKGVIIPTIEFGEFGFADESGNNAKQIMNFTNVAFYTIKGNVAVERGNVQTWCPTAPSLLIPVLAERDNKEGMDAGYYGDWGVNQRAGGYLIRSFSGSSFDASIYYNRTLTKGKDLATLMAFIGNAYIKAVTGGSEMIYEGLKTFPTKAKINDFDLISLIGPFLYIFIFQLIFPVILGSIVYEKEQALREIMKMMGLKMTTYWLITYIFSLLLYMIAFLLMWIAASILGFRYFTINHPGVVFLLFFLWGNVLVSFSFLFSVFFNKSRTASVVGYIWVFATGILAGQVIQEFFQSEKTPRALEIFLTIIPQFGLFRGLLLLSNGVSFEGPGLGFDKVNERGMTEVWIIMIIECVFFLILSFYLEAVLKTGFGVKKHPLFFLKRSFWLGEGVKYVSELKESVAGEPQDVKDHRKSLFETQNNYFLRVEDLHKVYPPSGGVPEKVAVKSLALGVYAGECFGFLGPNGAGKSTTISMLCGLYRPTSGTAVVDSLDLRENIDQIHMMMGVCPQDNILWENLTGPEHLYFYGRIKNLKGKQLDNAVHEGLKSVNLHEEKSKQTRQYSGGMKRRLSVACALMGNPKLVLLDEPSTGLDPASRRQLWDLINKQKKSCALLLTTHAMEEADALCDRLGIFADGELRCIGTSTELKRRYGKGYKLTVTTDSQEEERSTKFLNSLVPDAVMLNSIAGTSNFEIPKTSVKLSQFFSQMESGKEKAGIIDWGISNTTLEEVFLKTTEAEKDLTARLSRQASFLVSKKPVDSKSSEFELEDIDQISPVLKINRKESRDEE